ncbi:MAG: DUF421 domain-containing protein [Clostridiales bacterium]|nr:DUF421 domain-containing protein [Clostridiales bacterium]
MLVIFLRTIIIYFVVLIGMRIMGKSEISQFQPFEFVVAIMIADMAIIPMQDTGISIMNGIVSIIALLIVHILISVISIKSKKVYKVTSGNPSILINRGKIDMKEMEKQNMTINELIERLRQASYPYIEEVYYAILETSGELSVIEKQDKSGKNGNSERGLQTSLVINKKIEYNNLNRIGRDEKWLRNKLRKLRLRLEDIILLSIDEQENIVTYMEE